jgi:hypothetical protein
MFNAEYIVLYAHNMQHSGDLHKPYTLNRCKPCFSQANNIEVKIRYPR